VIEMETRLPGGDVALEPPSDDDGERATRPSPTWPTTARARPARDRARHRDWLAGDGIAQALTRSTAQPPHRRGALAEGQRRQLGRHDAARPGAEYGVSAERIRQIEVAAMKKMRKALGTA
jgi:RNA polymerase sigma-32 factor